MPTSDVQSGTPTNGAPDSGDPRGSGPPPNVGSPAEGASNLRAPAEEPSAAQARLAVVFTNLLLSPLYRRFVDSLDLTGDEHVIDYGSGSGAAARHLVRRLPDGELTCVDVSARWLATAKRVLRRHHNVRYVLGDIRDSGLPSESFDLILIHWMFHDVPVGDRRPVLETLVALLRPGGRIAFREPRAPSVMSDGEWIDPPELHALLTAAGLASVRWEAGWQWLIGRYIAGVFVKPDAAEPDPMPSGRADPGETPTDS